MSPQGVHSDHRVARQRQESGDTELSIVSHILDGLHEKQNGTSFTASRMTRSQGQFSIVNHEQRQRNCGLVNNGTGVKIPGSSQWYFYISR